jgi:hypothetical protein
MNCCRGCKKSTLFVDLRGMLNILEARLGSFYQVQDFFSIEPQRSLPAGHGCVALCVLCFFLCFSLFAHLFLRLWLTWA